MSQQYNGKSADVDTGLATAGVSISSSTNATPIVVTTATDHGLQTGDAVYIADHATNTAANGYRTVTRLTDTTFSLDGLPNGNGVGGATGRVYNLGFKATYLIPDDGDDLDAASVNVALAALGSEIAWLKRRLHQGRMDVGTGVPKLVQGNPCITISDADQTILNSGSIYRYYQLPIPGDTVRTVTLGGGDASSMIPIGMEVDLTQPVGHASNQWYVADSLGNNIAILPVSVNPAFVRCVFKRALNSVTGDWKPVAWSNGVIV